MDVRAKDDPVGPDVATELDASTVSSEELRFYLVVRRGQEARVLDVPEGAEVIVGRAEDAAIRADESRVSRRHARIARSGPTLTLEDLGSRNGTKVAGLVVRGATRPLASGDVIQVGSVEIVVAGAASGLASGVRVDGARREQPVDDAPLPEALDGMVVADEAMVRMTQLARRLAQTAAPILILGETGVGKEVIAERIHGWGPRAAGPLVRLNCASLPEALLESELFGHEKGAFTGADRRKTGWLERAHGGTLLLDETGEMPLSTQVKLLRVLETKRICRVGGVEDIEVDVRILCATHRDLEAEVARGRFREDLYYRINTFTITLPPLRERPTEIALLVELFARDLAGRAGGPPPAIDPGVIQTLQAYAWPGNVRELRNAVEHAYVMAEGGHIELSHFPAAVQPKGRTARGARGVGVKTELHDLERKRIVEALELHGGNQTKAARALGMSRRALIYKMHKYGLPLRS